MSTRCTTHFIDSDKSAPLAIIYRHSDGYPEVAGRDLLNFLKECNKLEDPRFDDPHYLAAKYVVFLADIFNHNYQVFTKAGKDSTDGRKVKAGGYGYKRSRSKLEFLSVGVVLEDPGDIEYRYYVDSSARTAEGIPVVTCYSIYDQKDVPIPSE